MTNSDYTEKKLLQWVDDYMNGKFTITSEKPLLQGIISLISPKLTEQDVFEVIFEQGVETPEEGVAALKALAESRE